MATYEVTFNPNDSTLSVGDDVAPWVICNAPYGLTLLGTALAIKTPCQGASIIIDIEKSTDGTSWSSIFDEPFVSGTHDGLDNASTLTDSSAGFPPDTYVDGDLVPSAYRGLVIDNSSDGSSGTISAVSSATNLSVTLTGGDNDWDTGDGYTIAVAGGIEPGEHIGAGGTPTATELNQGNLLRLDIEQCGVSPNPGSDLTVSLTVRQ